MDLNKDIATLISELQLDWQIEVVDLIKKKIQDYPVVDTGEMADSVVAKQNEKNETVFDMIDYGHFQDRGVNPEGIALYQSPFYFQGRWKGMAQYLKSWALSRDLNPYAVAYVLQFETGIKPKRFFRSTIEAMYPVLGKRIEQLIADKLNHDIQKYKSK